MEMATTKTGATRSVVFADPPGSKNYVSAEVPLQDMNDELMDTAFTKAVGCEGFTGGCEGMMSYYRFAKSVPLGEHWKHKYLVDFDGMGYSARAMSFLASESAMVKSTVYREYYSDWIQPWWVLAVHTGICVMLIAAQAALYPAVAGVQGDLQYPRLLLRAVTIHATCRQLDCEIDAGHRGRQAFATHSAGWPAVEADRGTQGGHGE
jgi:hypothetical protein